MILRTVSDISMLILYISAMDNARKYELELQPVAEFELGPVFEDLQD